MPPRSAHPTQHADPRTTTNAYIACGRNLYQVLGTDTLGRLELQNCRTLTTTPTPAGYITKECTLVKAAKHAA